MWSFVWQRICAGFLSFVYICIAVGGPVGREKGWNPISRLNPTTIYGWPKHGSGFSTSYVVVFFFLFFLFVFNDFS